MKFLTLVPALTALMAASASAFVNHPAFAKIAAKSDTSLYISSWGVKGSPYGGKNVLENVNIEENLQGYLKQPEAVEARDNVDGTVMVSGMIKTKERTDQTIFDLLNHEDSAFEFTKIVAFVDDMKFAKKRLLSRSARYSGLLDKLDFKEATAPGALPVAADLEGVKSWVACLEAGVSTFADIEAIAGLAKGAASVENVAILVTGATELDIAASKQALEALQGDDSLAYTLVAVGTLDEKQEGSTAYRTYDFGTEEAVLPENAVFGRDESLRMVTEMLQLECGKNKALCFREVYNQNITEAKLIRGLREAGYARPQEIDHMLRDGPANYKEAVKEFREKNPDAAKGYTTDAWWEGEEFQKSVKSRIEKDERDVQVVVDARVTEVEKIAMEWAKREFYRVSMSADGTTLNEADYIKEVWERALFEGDLKYRQTHGEATDPDGELADFQAQQERKQEIMLKRAKDDLRAELDKENLGGNVPGLEDEEEPASPDDIKMY